MSEHSEEEKLREEISRLQEEIRDLQKIFYTARGIALAVALLVTGYLGYTQFIQLPGAMKDAIPNAVKEYVDENVPDTVENYVRSSVNELLPGSVERQVDDYVAQSADIFGRIDEVQSHLLTSERKAVESVAEINSLLKQAQSIERGSRNYSDCKWVDVGYDKSHEKVGDWCEEGYFLTQLDLAGGVGPPGSWPIVEQARCCKP